MSRGFLVALAALVGAFLFAAPTAFGAPVTKTLNFPLIGNSTTNVFSLGPYSCCTASVFGVDLGDIHDVSLGLSMNSALSAPTHSDLTFTDTNLRQGQTLDLTNTYKRDAGGKLDVSYTLSFHANIYGLILDPSKTAGDTLNCSVPLLAESCQNTTSIGLFDITVLDVGLGKAKVHFSVPITTKADINGDGVASVRNISVNGAPVLGPDTLEFTSDPFVRNENTPLSCALPANQPVNYAMGTASSNVTGGVTENVGLDVSLVASPIVGPDFTVLGPFTIFGFNLPTKTINTIPLSAPGQNVDLGNLLPNLIAPTVAMDTIPSNGTEGNPIALGLIGTGPGGSLSPCGDSSLGFAWTFDDGGTASGKAVNHTFAENNLGGVPHTGSVVVTDPTGLKTTLPFSVPVADAPLVASCATPPVSLQAFNGTVASLTDGNPSAPLNDFTATISWGDSSSSPGVMSGSGGSYSVAGSHTYSSTGYYNVSVTVNDVGGSTATTTPPCTVLIFAFAPGGGSFVIGDKNTANNTDVTFWGSQWAKLNSLSGGPALGTFKGFAKNPTTPTCGTPWSTDPGNSTPPPKGPLPAYMGVIGTSLTSQSGSQLSGDTKLILVVKTYPGYKNDPGHAGIATVVTTACP